MSVRLRCLVVVGWGQAWGVHYVIKSRQNDQVDAGLTEARSVFLEVFFPTSDVCWTLESPLDSFGELLTWTNETL